MRDYSGWTIAGVIFTVIMTIAFAIAVALGVGWVFMWAWNEIVAGMFNGPEMEYWVAVAAIFILRSRFSVTIKKSGD